MLQTALTLTVLASTFATIILLCWPSRYRASSKSAKGIRNAHGTPTRGNEVSVQVVVLGDIGRSPRMQYHALSIANHGGRVQLIGYTDSDVHPDLLDSPRVTIVPLSSPPRLLQTSNRTLFLLTGPLKVFFQIWTLWITLGYRTMPFKWMLIQNPPSIPTLALARLICFLRCTNLVIDWHNFGYSILALKLGSSHLLVKTAKWHEINLGRGAKAHLTVTNAMKQVLINDFHLTDTIIPLHDRPAPQFQPLTTSARSAVLSSLPQTSTHSSAILASTTRLLVSSTSWTPDEDFSILLSALLRYSRAVTSTHPNLPEIFLIITGKGPLKQFYEHRIASLQAEGSLERITILTAWLPFQDYASLLAAADLGVCLHTSSSGLDLPMKVVDMFGAGLPVLGWNKDFPAWPELVHEGENGMGFGSAEEMAEKLMLLFTPNNSGLAKLKEGALLEGTRRWDDEWMPALGKLLGLVQ